MGLGGNWVEGVPFTVMVIMEGCTIALTILAKTALTGGISPFVFVVYNNALGSMILLPYSCFFHRERIFISQNLSFIGLSYSSPIVVGAMGLQIPAFNFLLAILLRRTKLDWRSSSIQARVIGTLISIMGAIVVELYKGPYIRPASFSSTHLLQHKHQLLTFYSTPDNWVLGGILLAAASLSVSVWNIIQPGTLKKYPQAMKVVSFYSLAGTIQCAKFSLIMERDLSAWKLKLNMELLLIVLTAIFGSVIRSSVHIVCTRMKGPFYVPMFKPFGIVFATLFGVSFFTNSLHYGSVIGAVIGGMGYYTVMWGQMREDETHKEGDNESFASSEQKAPLLQEDMQV